MIKLLEVFFTPNMRIITVSKNSLPNELFNNGVPLWFNNNSGYIWLFIALALLFAEIGTPGLFFFVAFAIGASAASVVAFLGESLFMQWIIALLVSIVSFLIIRLVLKKRKLSDVKYESSQTNIDALVGKSAVAVTKFDAEGRGRVKVGGEEWASKLEEEEGLSEGIAKGERVVIVGIRGNHLVVTKENIEREEP
jgi:membrane protein implicated in regulation of membrane protease activity